MRPALLLITALCISISNSYLQAQESSIVPGEITSAIDSAAVATPSLFDQQAIDTGLVGSSEVLNSATTTGETINLPDTTTYSAPSFAGSNDVQFSTGSANSSSRSLSQRIEDHLRAASLNAPTEGMTVSFLGGRASADLNDEFGRGIGERLHVGDMLGFSVGKRFSPTSRTDLEFSWRNSEARGFWRSAVVGQPDTFYEAELKHFSGMINFYYDFNRAPGNTFTPYIGMGLGAAQMDLEFTQPSSLERDETRFAIQSIIGVSARVTARNELFFEYRAFSTTEKTRTNTYRSNVFNESLFGWRYNF